MAAPLGLAIATPGSRQSWTVAAMYGEVLLVGNGLGELLNGVTNRTRPFVYNRDPNIPDEAPFEVDARRRDASPRIRSESEKSGYAHSTPMTQAVRRTLEKARQVHPRIGDGPILPSVSEPSRPAPPYYMRDLWHKAESAVGLDRKNGRGWHSVRRKFATELMHEPLKVLCKLGGWRDAETVLNCYQQPEERTMRAALERRAMAVSNS